MVIGDLKDLVHLLEQHPQWKAELCRLLLTKELLKLPCIVSELAEAQKELTEYSPTAGWYENSHIVNKCYYRQGMA